MNWELRCFLPVCSCCGHVNNSVRVMMFRHWNNGNDDLVRIIENCLDLLYFINVLLSYSNISLLIFGKVDNLKSASNNQLFRYFSVNLPLTSLYVAQSDFSPKQTRIGTIKNDNRIIIPRVLYIIHEC
jgi:hypothetical protein